MTSDAAKQKIYVKALFSLFSYLSDHISDCQFNKKTLLTRKIPSISLLFIVSLVFWFGLLSKLSKA